jgi:hypothetical protein
MQLMNLIAAILWLALTASALPHSNHKHPHRHHVSLHRRNHGASLEVDHSEILHRHLRRQVQPKIVKVVRQVIANSAKDN